MSQLDQIEGIRKNVGLAEFTTFHMGGPADFFVEIRNVMMIPALVEACKSDGLPFFLLGWGSNVIFSDKGFRGLVIRNLAKNCAIGEEVVAAGQPGSAGYRPAGRLINADSGTLLSQVIQKSLQNGLIGLEKMVGIPGTIGGAVRGNAGAFGVETRHYFEKALIYDPESGKVSEQDRDYLNFSYRHSQLKDSPEIILKVALRLVPGDSKQALEEVKQILTYRVGKLPQGYSAGSFFKNPSRNSIGEGVSAGQLIEECGFKGRHIGGAFISDKHANFLMNDGKATMLDVMELYTQIQKDVLQKFRIKLEREVVLVGEKGPIEDEFVLS